VAAGVHSSALLWGAGNSDSEAPRLGTFIPVESSTFRFQVPFAIVFWQTVSPSSTGGLRTQVRSLFGSAAMRTSSMPSADAAFLFAIRAEGHE
jgi:hypothetical protein